VDFTLGPKLRFGTYVEKFRLPDLESRAFAYLLYGHSRVGCESLRDTTPLGRAPSSASAEAALPDATAWASVFVGKCLPTYNF
jgi:hypothetical protein